VELHGDVCFSQHVDYFLCCGYCSLSRSSAEFGYRWAATDFLDGYTQTKASKPQQINAIGNQTGGRVFLFLATDDFWRDYKSYRQKGVKFVREPADQDYGTVAVFEDLYGNLWDLIQYG